MRTTLSMALWSTSRVSRSALLALSTLLVLAPAAQSAVTFTVDPETSNGNDLSELFPGPEITLDITLRSDGEPILGLLASVSGYDPGVLRFVSGTASRELFSEACVPSIGCFGGLTNSTVNLVEDNGRVIFANLYATSPVSGTGEIDEGVDGMSGGPQARLTFEIVGPGQIFFLIGSDLAAGEALILPGGSIGQTTNTQVTGFSGPEPNTTVLLGLGLGFLSRRRR